MPFRALRFETDAPTAERWSDALIEAGALSVDVADSGAGTAAEVSRYDELGARTSGLWPKNRVTVLFPDGFDVDGALAATAAALGEAPPRHAIDNVPDADWVRATQAQFQPLRVTDGLWVVPTWCVPVERRAINVRIDPGLAFGTGGHATTRLCLRWLAQNLPRSATLLDYGCGSGVLAIAAAKLGAAAVIGIDIDAQAIAVSRANAEANGVNATFGRPDELGAASSFDIVIANILADPLELLAPLLAARVRASGSIVLSGILEAQAEALIAAYSRWFNIAVWAQEEAWVVLAGPRATG